MSEKTNIEILSLSDISLVEKMGEFIRHHRLAQNKTQGQLAEEAGINRSTLSDFEQGRGANLITFIQLLRALHLLETMESFLIREQPLSPIQLAELAQAKRLRAGKTQPSKGEKPKSDW